jgi:hypothetical protein
LFIATDKVRYVGLALPKLKFRERAHPYIVVEAGDERYQSLLLSDMDRVVQTEFSKDFDVIMQRAIISATAKAVAQYALADQDSSGAAVASLFMAIYSFATTAADVRVWTSLPKEFQIARLEKPADGRIGIAVPGRIPFDIEIGNCNNAIVYVRIIHPGAEPVYDVIKL